MVLTADHGAMPDPAVSGGFQISAGDIQTLIEQNFDQNGPDVPVVDLVQPSQVFLNQAELQANGFTVADVARYVMTLTQAQTADGGVTPIPGHENDRVFQAVFPSALMQDLPCLPEAKGTDGPGVNGLPGAAVGVVYPLRVPAPPRPRIRTVSRNRGPQPMAADPHRERARRTPTEHAAPAPRGSARGG